MNLYELLHKMTTANASDLFLKADHPPRMRINGKVIDVGIPPLSRETIEKSIAEVLDRVQVESFLRNPDMDTALHISILGRFRINLFKQQGQPGMVIRLVHSGNLDFRQLHIPESIKNLSKEPRGLILVTGAAGSGKSTTVATMIDYINQTRQAHIVTIEDPIEYVFEDKQCIINQRQVGLDTNDFRTALKHAIRQSPDVIMIGEIRDQETIMTAISAAETGHLVITTIHTADTVQTLERIINYYPEFLRHQVRFELSLCLKGIICQRLIPRKDGQGRIPVFEIMLINPAIKKFIAEGRYYDIISEMKNNLQGGMLTFNYALASLVHAGKISEPDAYLYSNQPDELRLNLEGLYTGVDTFRA